MATTPTSKQSVIIGSVLAGLQVLTGGTALADALPAKAGALIVLIIGAIQVAWHNYDQTFNVTANAAVAATVTDGGTVVAGPAVEADDGTAVSLTSASSDTGA